jgi:hypothetical protein
LIDCLTAKATRLERALTNPIETDDRDDDLFLVNIVTATEKIKAPKKKQPAKWKSRSKTSTDSAAEGMPSQIFCPIISC